jgi:hypothetical protein
MTRPGLLLLLSLASGCVSVHSVPDAASEIDFAQTVDEMTGWRTYEKSHTFQSASYDLVYRAVKGALINANYKIIVANPEKGAIIGEHRTTWMHWERIAGIYLNQLAADVQLRIIIKTAADPGSIPDYTMSSDADRFLDGVRQYMDAETDADATGVR